MSFLAIWRDKHPGLPDPDEATMKRFQEPVLTWWREEHPGQPDPDETTLYNWLCEIERRDCEEEWREAHPGRPLPDNYEDLRRWAINERNMDILALLRAMGEKFH
jgi:hypothetical protein